MTKKNININTNIELDDAITIINILNKQQNPTSFLIPLANSILEQLNKSFFELDKLDFLEYTERILEIKNIIPLEVVLDKLNNSQKEKLFGTDTHNQIKNMLNTLSLQNENEKISYSMTALERAITISKFNFLDYSHESITPFLINEKIPQLLKQLTFIHNTNNILGKKYSNADIYKSKIFENALKDKKFLINFLPSIKSNAYKSMKNAIEYDITKLTIDDAQTYLNNIAKNRRSYLIREPFSIDIIKYHIQSQNDLDFTKFNALQLIEIEKIKPQLLPKDVYQTCISEYLAETAMANYKMGIDNLLKTLSNRTNITLNEKTYKKIFNLMTAPTLQHPHYPADDLPNIEKICKYIVSNTTNGAEYLSILFETKPYSSKGSTIKPIWDKINLENAITDNKNASSHKFKV